MLNKCLHILIDCRFLQNLLHVVRFSTRDRHARRIYRRTFSADENHS